MKSRGPYRRHSTPFKLRLCQDIRNGVIGRRDAQRTYGVSANLIQLWLTQSDRGELSDAEAEASIIAEYEAQIAALETKVGQLTMELDLVKKTPGQPIAGGITGSNAALKPIKQIRSAYGFQLDPHSCWMLSRSMEMLSLRMERAASSARKVAD